MHTTTVVPPAVENSFGEGAYTLVCSCGERVTYSGRSFTMVEAQRHQSWHARQANARSCGAREGNGCSCAEGI